LPTYYHKENSPGSVLNDSQDVAPKVSIGLPVYNGERYLREALDSILDQTFTDFELIICDNASTDGTIEICKEYEARDPRISLYLSKQNHGASWNFNRAFHHSRGEYFRWAAHDDKIAPTLLEACVEVLDNNPAVILCYPKTTIIDEEGQTKKLYNDGLDLHSVDACERFEDFLFCPKRENFAIFGLMRREVLGQTSLLKAYEASDRVLMAELTLRGEIYEIDDYLFFRRDHPMTSRRANKGTKEINAWFDPKKKSLFYWTTGKVFYEYVKFPRRVPMTILSILKYYYVIGTYAFSKVFRHAHR